MLWAALTFFCVLSAYYVLRPVRDALVLDGDPAFIPWLFTATFALMLAVAAPWGAMVARWPRAQLVARAYRLFIAQLLLFAALLALDVAPMVVGKVFYVWVSMFNLFVVSVFWSLCADLIRPEQGRRIFGLIAAGGSAGALAGPAMTRALAAHLDTELLLVLSALLMELATWCAGRLQRAAHGLAQAPAAPAGDERAAAAPAAEPAQAIGGAALAGFPRVARSPYLVGIASYVVAAACLATFVYLRQAEIVKRALPVRAERTEFFAEVELWTSIITLGLQLLVTARLLRWLGAGVVLAALPLAQGVGALALAAQPTLAVTTAVSSVGRALTHGLSRPTREWLFTAVAREDKYKAKNLIDTFVVRFGDFGSAWLLSGLAAAGVGAVAVIAPLAVVWTLIALALGREHRWRVQALQDAQAPNQAPNQAPR